MRYEGSVLSTVMAARRSNLREKSSVDVALVGKTEVLAGSQALVADKLMHHGMHICSGDVVISSSLGVVQVGRVAACCLEYGRSCCVVSEMQRVRDAT